MKKVCILAVCALALFSCQKENNGPEESPVPDGYVRMTLKAVSDETKTTVDGTTVKWAKNDQIKVYFSNGEAVDFTLVGDGGSASGEFEGTAPVGETAHYAVYPTDLYDSVSGTTVNVTIPDDEQDGVFGKGNIAVAKVDEDKMSFKNVNAFVGFTVPANITKVVISSVNTEKNLYGTLAVNCLGDPTAGALSGGGSSITVTFPVEKVSTGGTYYVAIAPGVELDKGLLLEWYKGSIVSGTYWLNKAITTVANNVYDMGSVSTSGDYYVSVDGGEDVKNGMSWETAWSADQFWSKIHLNKSDPDKTSAKLANINGATFHLAAGTYNWGSDAAINIDDDDFGTVSFTIMGGYDASTGERDIENYATIFTGDDDADGTGDHRILLLDGKVNIEFNGITFTKGRTRGSEDNRFGGAVMIKAGSHSFVDCTFTQNSAETSGKNKGYGGAIRFNSTGNLILTGTTFSYNTATGDSGALSLKAGTTIITDCSFSNNSAPSGGAIDCCESSAVKIFGGSFSYNSASTNGGGAIAVEQTSTLEVNTSDSETTYFTYNSANKDGGAISVVGQGVVEVWKSDLRHNHADDRGGAITVVGGGSLKLFSSYFKQNYAPTGGAVYTTKESTNYPVFFVNGCSFEGNHITNINGCTFNIDAVDKFVMYNSSVRDSYTKSTSEENLAGTAPCWIAIDGVNTSASLANCSIIGDTWDGNGKGKALTTNTALIVIWEKEKTIYFSNCIIVPESNINIKAIRGYDNSHKAIIDRSYTHSGNFGDYIVTNYDNGGNTTGHAIVDFGGSEGTHFNWTSNCWQWNGYIKIEDSYINTYNKATKDGVYSRLNNICSDFVTWSGAAFYKDQVRGNRGNGDWWPGAYQSN